MRIALTLTDGSPVVINFNHVSAIQPSGGNTLLRFSSGHFQVVREEFVIMTEMLNDMAKAQSLALQ